MMILLPRYQATGAALAALIANVIVLAILAMGVARAGGVPIGRAFVPGKEEVLRVWSVIERVVRQPLGGKYKSGNL